MALDINGYSTAAWGHAALPVRKRLDHRGPLSIDVSAAWYFITICAEGHRPWVVDNGRAACPHAAASHQLNADVTFNEIARMILAAAEWYHEHGKWRLALFLVMPDHLHFIVRLPVGADGGGTPSLPGVMRHWKHYVSEHYGVLFQKDFWDTRLRDDAHLAEKFCYICNNPVRKGLCATARDWRYVIAFDRDTGVERNHK